MGKVMRHTLGASWNIRHNLSSSKGPKPLQLKLLTTYIPKTSAFTRSVERFSRNAETDLVCRLLLEKKKGGPVRGNSPEGALRDGQQGLRVGSSVGDPGVPGDQARRGRGFLFNHPATTEIYTLSLHDALPICLNIRHNLSSSKGPKPLQLKLLTTYIPKTSAFTLAFSTSQRLRTTRASARTFFTFRHYITPSARNF